MTGIGTLIGRNCKLFFKDKGMFYTSLITPIILLVLYVTFLGKVYKDAFSSIMPQGIKISESLIDGAVGGQLISSLLAVCCVTVAFCSNLLMVNDKITGARRDLTMTPVSNATLAISYYVATLISTLIVCFSATAICFAYLAKVGWYLSVADVAYILFDVLLLVLFGTAISSIVSYPLTTAGQGSAVGTIVSSGYGFICGAYMPISNFPGALQKVLSFLPGTYGTALLRNHAMRGVYAEMKDLGIPANAIKSMRDAIDCNLYFFGKPVSLPAMFVILGGAVLVFIGIYILLNACHRKRV